MNLVFQSIPEHVVIHDKHGNRLIDNGVLDDSSNFKVLCEPKANDTINESKKFIRLVK